MEKQKPYVLVMMPVVSGSKTCPPRRIEFSKLSDALDSLEESVRGERGEEGASDEEIEATVEEARSTRSFWGGNYDYFIEEN